MKSNVRITVVLSVFLLGAIVLLVRLYAVQVIDQSYKGLAESNIMRKIPTHPARGLMYDRQGNLLVDNQPIYDIMVVPKDVAPFDTLKFCELFKISRTSLEERLKTARYYSRYKPSILIKQISPLVYANAQGYMYQFPGFFAQVRTIRHYHAKVAPHIYGYLGEVDDAMLDKDEYYALGDYIGVSGVEKTYEDLLRGDKGVRYVTVDKYNRETARYNDGELDKPAKQGVDLQLTIDRDLQAYGEQLMQNKIGSIVAIEPESGEILAMVSSPSYDPELLTGRQRSFNVARLNADTLKPQLNRCITAIYPPGSTFKPLVALIGLQEGAIRPNHYYACRGAFWIGAGTSVKCSHGHAPCRNVQTGIEQSCNPYFCDVFKRTIENPVHNDIDAVFDRWVNYVYEFGFGQSVEMGLPGLIKGTIPTVDYFDTIYKGWRWKANTIISLSIGQGEIAVTPLQIANYVHILANRGEYRPAHIVRTKDPLDKIKVSIDREHFDVVVDGMEQVMTKGTGKWSQIEGISTCGKTGTAENPHGDDHSIFIFFAPKDDPKIAIAAIVENAGYGSTFAAPMCALMTEKYLTGKLSKKAQWREKKILEANLIEKPVEE